MTSNEVELVAALEADIQAWEAVAAFFENSVTEIDVTGGKKISGKDYGRGLRVRIAQNRELVEKIRKGKRDGV